MEPAYASVVYTAPGARENSGTKLGQLVAFAKHSVGVVPCLPGGSRDPHLSVRRPLHLPIPLLLPDMAAMEAVCTDIPPPG
jgi:hypothetical protein